MENTYNVKIPTLDDMLEFVRICNQFDEDIDYKVGSYSVDAKSVMGVLSTTLGLKANVTIFTDNTRVTDSFIDKIQKWIVGYF